MEREASMSMLVSPQLRPFHQGGQATFTINPRAVDIWPFKVGTIQALGSIQGPRSAYLSEGLRDERVGIHKRGGHALPGEF